ncbi:MAG: DUF1841 family protein [Candidatus Thiodiazotropha sp.]|jgi:hypothetical protein
MDEYDPSIAPVSEEWLALPEDERIELVRSFHDKHEKELLEEGQREAHAGIHVAVENQIAMAYEPVPATIARLIRQGLSRHEAIHAVGAVLSDQLWSFQKQQKAKWEIGPYRRKLEKLTAKRWRKGKW